MATFGIEEEYMFLDPSALSPAHLDEAAHHRLLGGAAPGRGSTTHEFLFSQIERSTPVCSRLDEAEADLSAFRARISSVAHEHGLLAAAVGAPFQSGRWPRITEDRRYRTVEAEFRGVVADHVINGAHVHVGVPDRDAGVQVLNRLRVWLPTILAIAGNSPFWRGEDTGFSSWRALILRRWSTTGCPPVFADADDYDRRIHRLIGVGGTYDLPTIAWGARLSERYPTVEVRVADAQLDVGQALLLAAVVRGVAQVSLVEAERGTPPLSVAPELLDAALWHAARDGTRSLLLDPATGELRPAREVVGSLLRHIAGALEAEGDTDRVREALARHWRRGTGADRQRSAFRRGGREALGALIDRSLLASA